MARKKLTKDETFSLLEGFHKLLVAVGEFRFENMKKKNLTKAKSRDLEDLQWTLFNIVSDLNAESVIMKTALLDKDIKVLMQAAKAMKSAAAKINQIKKVIRVASMAIAFGGAIASGHVPAVVSAGQDLIGEIKNA